MQISEEHRKLVLEHRALHEARALLGTDRTSDGVSTLSALAMKTDSPFSYPAALALSRMYRIGGPIIPANRERSEYWMERAYDGSWITRTLHVPDPITAFLRGGRYLFASQAVLAITKIDEIDGGKRRP